MALVLSGPAGKSTRDTRTLLERRGDDVVLTTYVDLQSSPNSGLYPKQSAYTVCRVVENAAKYYKLI